MSLNMWELTQDASCILFVLLRGKEEKPWTKQIAPQEVGCNQESATQE